MNKLQKRRLTYLIIFMTGVSLAASLIFYALKQNLNVFVTPSEIAQKPINEYYSLRLGAMVKPGSIQRSQNSLDVKFIATDFKHELPVTYAGILPDLFREGQGVVCEGKLVGGTFIADEVLAKHDEKYMPPEVADALKKSGQWKGNEK